MTDKLKLPTYAVATSGPLKGQNFTLTVSAKTVAKVIVAIGSNATVIASKSNIACGKNVRAVCFVLFCFICEERKAGSGATRTHSTLTF